MSGICTPERNRRIVENQETEAAIAFTSRTDGTRHRFRFLNLEDQPGMWRLHEVEEDRDWRIVGCEPIRQLRVGRTEQSLIE
jgi:hypothetical protein